MAFVTDLPFNLSYAVTPYILAVEAITFACIAALALMIWRDRRAVTVATSTPKRHLLKKHLANSNMARMLGRMNVDTGTYLRHTPMEEIDAQINACVDCRVKSHCDETMACHRTDVDLSFCPNRAVILQWSAFAATRVARPT